MAVFSRTGRVALVPLVALVACGESGPVPGAQPEARRQALTGHPRLYFSPSDVAALQAQTQAGVRGGARAALTGYCTFVRPDGGPGTGLDSDWARCSEEAALRAILEQNPNYADSAMNNLLAAANEDASAYWASLAGNNHSVYGVGNKVATAASAYDLLGAYAGLGPSQQATLRAELEQYASLLYGFVGRGAHDALGNYEVSAYAGLGMVALVLDGESTHPDRAGWQAAAEAHLGLDVFNDLWNPGGLYQEGYGYSLYGSPMAVRFALALRRHTGRDLLAGANILAAPDWLTWGFLPHGEHLAFADAHKLDGAAYAAEYLHLVDRGGNRAGLWGWHAAHGSSGLDRLTYGLDVSSRLGVVMWYPSTLLLPADPSAAGRPLDLWFGDTANGPLRGQYVGSSPGQGGLGILRAGWGADTVAATLQATDEWPGSHGHADSHAFTLSAYGEALALDLGYGNSAVPDRKRGSAHNRVFVTCCDDLGSFRRSFKGERRRFFGGQLAGYARIDGRYPLGSFNWDGGSGWDDPAQWAPLTRADRLLLLVRGPRPYVVLADDLEDSTGRSFRWQAYVPNVGVASGAGTTASPLVLPSASAARLEVSFVEPAQGASAVVVPATEVGQLAPQRRVQALQTGPAAQFLAVLYPRRSASSPERPAISALSATGGTGVALQWSDGLERLALRAASATTVSAGALATSGRFAWVRTAPSGQLTAVLATEADALSLSGQSLLRVQGGSADVSSTAGRVEVEGAGLTSVRVWGPSTSTFLLNGQTVAFRQVGPDVEWPPAGGVDAGLAPDAGRPDGGAAPDAGAPDGGTRPDAGRADGGAAPDAGTLDAGAAFDAGAPDAGAASDAGTLDAGTSPDGGTPDEGPDAGVVTPEPSDERGTPVRGGCGCEHVLGNAFLAVVLLMLRGHRVRRRR